jgi:hypothetical protein
MSRRYGHNWWRTAPSRSSKRLRWDARYRGVLILWIGSVARGYVELVAGAWLPKAYNRKGPPCRRRVDAKRWVECELARGST